MSREYREVAKKLGVRYLIGRWGVSFKRPPVPSGIKQPFLPRLRITPLNGWSFDTHEIIEAFANDPDFSIKYADDAVSDLASTNLADSEDATNPPNQALKQGKGK